MRFWHHHSGDEGAGGGRSSRKPWIDPLSHCIAQQPEHQATFLRPGDSRFRVVIEQVRTDERRKDRETFNDVVWFRQVDLGEDVLHGRSLANLESFILRVNSEAWEEDTQDSGKQT